MCIDMKENNVVGSSIKGPRLVHEEQSVAEEKVTDPGQNESMKGSLKMWSIFPVFPAVKQKCQVFTWLSWGLSYIYLFQFIIVFIL